VKDRAQPCSPIPASIPSSWLNARRIRAQCLILALCLWGVVVVDFSTSGLFDRAGNIKFQDSLPLYISARLISQHRTRQLFDEAVIASEMHRIVQQPTNVRLASVYGPQVGLLFLPLMRFSFSVAGWIWAAINVVWYVSCIYVLWKDCPNLRGYASLVAIAAAAFPPLFHSFVRGQVSALVVACFTAAFLAFRSGRKWLAGAALGFLIFKPQFLVAIPLIFLLSGAWQTLAGLSVSAFAQLAFAWIYFGSAVMRTYLDKLWHVSSWIGAAELAAAPVQMHSLRSFWTLLLPWPMPAFVLYVLSSLAIVTIAVWSWRSSGSLTLRFSALILAAVLVNPHLFVYDLLALAPVILLLADWALDRGNQSYAALVRLLLYLSFTLPLLGPLTFWTHLQLSVPVFIALQWTVWSVLNQARRPAGSFAVCAM
jgi:alpha-1,2-mannosyltransferase